MGGIKNKLNNKLSNKTLFKLGSRLVALTKYLSIACLSLAILSTLVLNIVSSYSSSKIKSNAIDSNSEVSTLAQATGPATISLSITSSSSSTGGNDPNLSLSIPQGGGIATGRHTISVVSNSYAGYSVTVEGSGSSTDMSAPDFGTGTSSNNELIKSTNATITNPSTLSTNTWGIAIPGKQGYSNKSTYELGITNPNDQSTQSTLAKVTFGAVPPKLAGETIMSSNQATGTNHDGSSSDSQNIYYGANIDQFFRAGSYSEEVVYTATVKLPSKPTITSLDPNMVAQNASNTPIAIYGTNLLSTYNVYVDMGNGSTEQCTNLTVLSDSKLTCTLPTFTSTGDYVLVLETQGGEDSGVIRVVARPVINSIDPPTIETNNNQAVVTLIGEDLANVSQVFVDFNSNERADSGETCQIQSILIGQYISCLAPEYGSVGEFNVYAVSDGILSNSVELGYIEPEPTISVTSVLPEHVDRERYLEQVNFSISGENLADVARVVLYGTSTSYTGELECTIVSVGANRINCNVNAWQYLGHTYDQYVSVTFYDSGGNVLLQMGRFCSFD